MTPRHIFLISPHSSVRNSRWFSPGRSSKLSRVVEVLKHCGYQIVLFNTCPDSSRIEQTHSVSIAGSQQLALRLFELFFNSLGFNQKQIPAFIWVYNSRAPEVLVSLVLSAKYPQAKVVVQIEDLPRARDQNAGLQGFLDWIFTHILLRRASLITCVSRQVASSLSSQYSINPDRIHLLPPLLSCHFANICQHRLNSPFSRRNIRIMYAGGYAPEKGIEDIISAFQKLPQPSYRLHLFGSVPLHLRLLAQCDPYIYIHGLVDDISLCIAYANADIVLNPHKKIRNVGFVFPFKTFECICSGALPIISTLFSDFDPRLPASCYFTEGSEGLLRSLLNAKSTWHANSNLLAAIQKDYLNRYSTVTFSNNFGLVLRNRLLPYL